MFVYFIDAEQNPVMYGTKGLLVISMWRKISRVILATNRVFFCVSFHQDFERHWNAVKKKHTH